MFDPILVTLLRFSTTVLLRFNWTKQGSCGSTLRKLSAPTWRRPHAWPLIIYIPVVRTAQGAVDPKPQGAAPNSQNAGLRYVTSDLFYC